MTRKPSNLSYGIAGFATLAVIVVAWLGRDWLEARSVRPGARAPAFEATTLDGQPASLADFQGQVVLLNIWATWCAPCRFEMPSMERLYQELQGEAFEIVAVSVDAPLGQTNAAGTPGGDIKAFAESLSLTFPMQTLDLAPSDTEPDTKRGAHHGSLTFGVPGPADRVTERRPHNK